MQVYLWLVCYVKRSTMESNKKPAMFKIQRYEYSKLYLQTVKKRNEKRKYQFLWIVYNYEKLQSDIKYLCHSICISGKHTYLQIKMRKEEYSHYRSPSYSLARETHEFTSYLDSNILSNEELFFTLNGHLKIKFEITLSSKEDLYIPLLRFEQSFKVQNHMDDMFTSGLFSDLKISVGDKVFNVHKVILATRSKVFAAMLEADMKEKSETNISIQDFESDIFGEFLRYLYSNNLNLSNVKSAVEFYKLSEKYDLPDLKSNSSIFLSRNLNAENVIQMQNLADLYGDSKLKKITVDYMFHNLLEVMKSSDWSSFQSSTNEVNNLFSILGKFVSEDTLFLDHLSCPKRQINDLCYFLEIFFEN